ncbi:VOC family protein [Demequina mangrovi]|uniref:PhnB protein n=1 Tax=Demequina mangrovi TaxID=1043493 RepID=A0A1H6W7F6_9MICO|nr:VOC family protein [Demequina mangrovi]SEJ08422.1 PhnB protein [Demequina mangrovi]
MASVSTYLNFDGTCEEAFAFYRDVFGGELTAPIMRMGEVPPSPGMPPVPEDEKDRVMHCALDILGGHRIMGSDIMPSMGHVLKPGNNVYLNLAVDDEDQLRDLFARLSAGGDIEMEPTPMFWGDLYASFTDRFGIQWMLDTAMTEGTGLA